jgi:hypothetical protein
VVLPVGTGLISHPTRGVSATETVRRHARTFYRIVLTNPPTLDDFLSNRANRRAPRSDDPAVLQLWDGLSVFATLAQARRKARGAPYLGPQVAQLRIPEGASARFERTRGPGHYTLWAEAAAVLARVVSVVREGPEE